jgi:hypothetical protein
MGACRPPSYYRNLGVSIGETIGASADTPFARRLVRPRPPVARAYSLTVRIGLREAGVALVAAAVAAAIAAGVGAIFGIWPGVGTAAGLGIFLLAANRHQQRPIRDGEIVVAAWGLNDLLVRVESVSGPDHQRVAKIWVQGPEAPWDPLKPSSPYALNVPYATLRRRTLKEHLRAWLFR